MDRVLELQYIIEQHKDIDINIGFLVKRTRYGYELYTIKNNGRGEDVIVDQTMYASLTDIAEEMKLKKDIWEYKMDGKALKELNMFIREAKNE